jgi:hypothetical protein
MADLSKAAKGFSGQLKLKGKGSTKVDPSSINDCLVSY